MSNSTRMEDVVNPVEAKRLEAEFSKCERRFATLVRDLHLPFLDVKLYRKYFFTSRTRHKLNQLLAVLDTMSIHRLHTVRLLKAISDREQLIGDLQALSEEYCKIGIEMGQANTLVIQTKALQLLHMHQQVTLKIVEGVASWRSLLTQDYPFMWKGKNYLLKIADDCKWIDESPLHKILPLRVSEFPLCSNISSLSLFAIQKLLAVSGEAVKIDSARHRAAEASILREEHIQHNLLRELEEKSSNGCFVMLLQHDFIPNCATGIRVSKEEWGQRYREALTAEFHNYSNERHEEEHEEKGVSVSDSSLSGKEQQRDEVGNAQNSPSNSIKEASLHDAQ